ncbi:hypothetical protein HUG17_4680 [Dermatophagoides farinae]|uniref:Uncharacterized protein n=1 Tax=Dermatophagoides farinae TaxID=6954 RepID=A0A9D4SHU3_DERFA|nr:hypothetical protein HUG17_4680 [Dermatophagoides farinae]
MKNKYYRFIHNHINNLYHYDEIIRKQYYPRSTENYNENEQIEKSNEMIRRPFWNVIVPGLICCLYSFGLFVYLIWPDIVYVHPFFLIVPHMYPANIRIYCSIMSLIWGVNYIFQVFYGLSTDLRHYQFLHILHLNKSNGRGLDQENLRRLRLFRDRVSIGFTAWIAISFAVIQQRLWEHSILWLFFWSAIFMVWCLYVSSGLYQFSAFILTVNYYLILKQKSLQRKMHRFYLRLIRGNRKSFPGRYFEFVRLNKAFVELQKEIVFNSIQLVRFLSILFISFSVALTYLTCVLFLAWMPILYIIVYLIIYVAHLISLSAFIQYGSKIEYLNRNFLRFNRKCLCNEHHFFSNKYLLKQESVTSTMLECPVGMMLLDGSVITGRTQFALMINISTFFYLICRRIT